MKSIQLTFGDADIGILADIDGFKGRVLRSKLRGTGGHTPKKHGRNLLVPKSARKNLSSLGLRPAAVTGPQQKFK